MRHPGPIRPPHVLAATLLVVALALVLYLALPATTSVRAERVIDAWPATVYALLNDFRRAGEWLPLVARDPNARLVYSGAERGEGATLSWDGPVAGSGTQTIVEAVPFERVRSTAAESGVECTFELSPAEDMTRVAWLYRQEHGLNPLARLSGWLSRNAIRRDLEEGLERLATLAATLPRTDFADLDAELLVVEAQDIAYRRVRSAPHAAAISEAMGAAYFDILSFIDRHGLEEAGAPLSITRSVADGEVVFDAAVPVRGAGDATVPEAGGVRLGRTYGGRVLRARHVGPYRRLGETHRKIASLLAAAGIPRNGDVWETYVSDPSRVDEEELITLIYYPVRSNTASGGL